MSDKELIEGWLSDLSFEELLHTDSLLEAEKITGLSYKEDEPTMWLGFSILQGLSAAKEVALTERGDTTFRNELSRYQSIIEDYGFELVRSLPFAKRDNNETQFTYWHKAYGLVLIFDTYEETGVNSGSVYYVWRRDPEAATGRWTANSSPLGAYIDGRKNEEWDGTIFGSHDCREALIFNLENLRTHGEFIVPWPAITEGEGSYRVYFSHHGDEWPEDYKERSEFIKNLNAERLAELPAEMRESMGCK